MGKQCTKCSHDLPLEDFGPRKGAPDGLKSWCRPCERDYLRQWRESHPEKNNEYNAKWRDENREKKNEQNRSWKRANVEFVTESNQKWIEANRDKVAAYARISRARLKANNPELAQLRMSEYNNRRRVLIGGGHVGVLEYKKILDDFNGGCAYCPEPFQQWDHYVPLSKGGAHQANNLVPACAKCNGHKSARLPIWEWVGQQQ